jgi:biotin transport system substrate-specific component
VSIRDIALIALFAAIMGVLGLVPKIDVVFLPVPITAQTLGVMLAGSILGAKRAALAMVLFLALVAAGLPLLAGGRGGLGVFAGPSAGFILGYAVSAFVIGWLTERNWTRLTFLRLLLINLVGGIVVLYAIGVPVITLIAGVPLASAVAGSAVFLPGDILKAVLAASAARFVHRGYPLIHARGG